MVSELQTSEWKEAHLLGISFIFSSSGFRYLNDVLILGRMSVKRCGTSSG